MKTKSICMMAVIVMLVALQANATWVEDWNYTLNTPLTSVSPWTLGWSSGGYGDTAIVSNAWQPNPPRHLVQANAGFRDTAYLRTVNYLPDIQSGGPIIRVETAFEIGGANTNVFFGLGQYPSWAGSKQAFNIWARRVTGQGHTEFKITNAAGTVYVDSALTKPHLKWYDVRVDIDPLANSGNGELDFYYKLKTATEWTASAPLTNINLQLKSNAAIDNPYTEWTGMFTRLSRTETGWGGEGCIGGITLTSIPEPATIVVLSLGALTLLRRRVA